MKAKKLDIIVPVYNEDSNVESLVKRTHSTLIKAGIDYRLIFVDDNSSDKTISILKKLKKDYPVLIHIKEGKKGKAFSILEGMQFATSEYVVMIDGDCQYPPEAIPQMLEKTKDAEIIVANRRKSHTSKLRALASRANAFVFGKLLMGLDCDVQSGLKLFKRDILERIDESQINQWSLDMELLSAGKEMGYKIDTVDIDFDLRTGGESKVNLLSTTKDLVTHAIKLRLRPKLPFHLKSEAEDTMRGAGVHHKRQKFITHTTLDHNESAIHTFHSWQKIFIWAALALLVSGLILNLQKTALVFTAILSTIYFIDVLFNLYLVMKSLYFPPEYAFTDEELGKLKDKDLPVYSVLVPLYREASVLPGFVDAIGKMDWPKDKLDVMLLLEEDDDETQQMAKDLNMPSYIRTVIVPHSFPKTKPKACNYGLSMAKGEYSVIYDAEDIPDVLQLKKAYAAFKAAPDNIFCLQAKLNYHNPHHNLLTRFFTAEYSLWFDLILPGLQSIETSIPLGGTSNHFKTANLKKLQGWDPFNVTEDADLGIRLFKEGYRTAIIDSVTLEEANSDWGNWIRQRSRWIKGYMQTYLVHMRHPLTFLKKKGVHALIFQLVVGGKIAFMLINPILWILTILYFTLYSIFGPSIEALYPTAVFYMAVISLVFGNFLCLYYYMIGCAKRGHWTLIKYVYFVPFYWLMVSVAAVKALNQLIFKPHFWEKTNHGLHLKKEVVEQAASLASSSHVQQDIPESKGIVSLFNLRSGAMLVGASIFANFFNFIYNAYLGRHVSVEEFGTIGLLGSFLYISQVPFAAITRAVTHHTGFIFGTQNTPATGFWRKTRKKTFALGVIFLGVYIALMPSLLSLFNLSNVSPLIMFAPVWIIGFLASADTGFLSGSQMFSFMAIMIICESVSKLLFTYFVVESGNTGLIYLTLPVSMSVSFVIGWLGIQKINKRESANLDTSDSKSFPMSFFGVSVLNRLSSIAFLGLDVILAKSLLNPTEAGHYALLSMIGKMAYFFGSLFSTFIVPLVSREQGANKDPYKTFQRILLATILTGTLGYLFVGTFGHLTAPILFGQKTLPILPLLPIFMLGVVAYTISNSIVIFHQSKKEYLVPIVDFSVSIVQVVMILLYKHDLYSFSTIMATMGIIHLIVSVLLHRLIRSKVSLKQNAYALFNLFGFIPNSSVSKKGKLKILMLNWRDTRHVWSGGAESYVHGLAKHWARLGHKVTIFCGNDGKSPRNEVIDGIQIVRRGGFYTVYLWAAVYYILRFRGIFDVVVESQNGMPFFTPLYVRVPKFMVIHHVHQEVFMKHLKFPLAQIAMFIEKYLNPFFYRNNQVITVSNSSKADIIKNKIAKAENITVISPGIELSNYKKMRKTQYPTFIYLGRLKPYKNINVAIEAFAKVLQKFPKATLKIAGEGESKDSLIILVKKLGIEASVKFLGKVSEKRKVYLLATSWVAIQPSSVEGWGITVIEANACGTPVIASDVSGLRDSVINGKTGVLVPLNDVEAFAEAMVTLADKKQGRFRYTRVITDWSEKFSWENSAQKFFEVIINSINEGNQSKKASISYTK